jgi:hypothetical protein
VNHNYLSDKQGSLKDDVKSAGEEVKQEVVKAGEAVKNVVSK